MKTIKNCFVKEAGNSSQGLNILSVIIKDQEFYLVLNIQPTSIKLKLS